MSTISVIVPVYNVEKYIHRCVDSILDQTHTDFELILVNDGSPDNCGAICDAYAAVDQRITVIHQENKGLSSARNAGLKIATGAYISFVDSDDCIHREMFEVLLAALEQSGADMVKSNFVSFSGTQPTEAPGTRIVTVYSPEMAFDNFMNITFSPNKHMKSTVWDGLYCRRMFFDGKEPVLQFPVGKQNEDTYLFPELIFRASKIAHIDSAFYFYFENAAGITHSSVSKREINSCDLWEHVYRIATPYTQKHNQTIAFNSATRYLAILRKIYHSKYRRHYFRKTRSILLADNEKLLSQIKDTRVKRTLFLIRIYPIYQLSKRLFGNNIY